MQAKLIRSGNDLVIRLAASEAARLGLREGQTVEVTPRDASSNQVSPVNPAMPTCQDSLADRRLLAGRPAYTLDDMIAEMRRLGPNHAPETVDWGPDRGCEIIDDDAPR